LGELEKLKESFRKEFPILASRLDVGYPTNNRLAKNEYDIASFVWLGFKKGYELGASK